MKNSICRTIAALFLLSVAGCGVESSGGGDVYSRTPLEDTEANRIIEADRYLVSADLEEMMTEMTKSMNSMMPPDQVEAFNEVMTEHLDFEKFSSIMRASVVKNFTAEEIRVLADFYESPVGKSVMQKMGPYMQDAMPGIMKIMMEAMSEVSVDDQEGKIEILDDFETDK
ncbi:MAG: hypothetical protein ACI8TQ_002202 [Planctomycetota bacterium]|jgi:hypothetical protein